MMRALDERIIESHERAAHWFQRWTGRTNFWLARFMWFLYILSQSVFVYLADAVPGVKPVGTAPLFVVCLLMGVMSLWVDHYCRRMEDRYAHGGRIAPLQTAIMRDVWGFRWALYAFWIFLDIQALSFFPSVTWERYLFFTFWLSLIPFSYFLACVPLPPVRETGHEAVLSPAS